MFRKKLFLLFIALVVSTLMGAGCLSATKETKTSEQVKGIAEEQQEVTVNVTLGINTGVGIQNYNITVPKDEKVVDVLKSASSKYNFALEIKDSSYGPFVQSIAGKAGGENGKYWIYYVNGQKASVGVGEQIVKENDIIEFRLE